MDPDDRELEYYRDVEDLFATLRGAPHVLSPRDFQLLRSWWRDGVPMVAVSAGLTEVFARQRERDDADPVVSLSYCRHAVRRQARRIAEMQIGASPDRPDRPEEASIDALANALRAAAETESEANRRVKPILERIAAQTETAGRELAAGLIDEHLFALESAMLEECWRALPESDRRAINDRVATAVDAAIADADAQRRSARALRDRETRLLLGLPRMELDR
jgi:hypothetical protein